MHCGLMGPGGGSSQIPKQLCGQSHTIHTVLLYENSTQTDGDYFMQFLNTFLVGKSVFIPESCNSDVILRLAMYSVRKPRRRVSFKREAMLYRRVPTALSTAPDPTRFCA